MKNKLKNIIITIIGLIFIVVSIALAVTSVKMMYNFFQIIIFGEEGSILDIISYIAFSILSAVYALITFIGALGCLLK